MIGAPDGIDVAGPAQNVRQQNAAGIVGAKRRQPRMARPYAELTRSLTARLIGAPRWLSPAALDVQLDRVGSSRGLERFSALRDDADGVRDRAGLMRLAQRLYQWRMALAHGHR